MNERNRTLWYKNAAMPRHPRLDRSKILLSTALDRRHEPLNGELKLRGNEGIVTDLE